uniref:hypothetical protein n=1 Tax=Streptomyces cacaoi TaxID=1898 RepID=UPI001B8006B8
MQGAKPSRKETRETDHAEALPAEPETAAPGSTGQAEELTAKAEALIGERGPDGEAEPPVPSAPQQLA